MIVLLMLGFLGAGLAAFFRRRMLAVPAAITIAASLRGLVSVVASYATVDPGRPWWARVILSVQHDPVSDYLPLLVACGGAAGFAAMLMMMTDTPAAKAASQAKSEPEEEPRPLRDAAEARQKAILGL